MDCVKQMVQARQRQQWRVTGQVQGVGFRPFVYRLAQRFNLTGSVRNDSTGVALEVQGLSEDLDAFFEAFQQEAPALVEIDHVARHRINPVEGERFFSIFVSKSARGPQAAVTVDTAVCRDCLNELNSASNHRYGYALINCTNCGPRYTILRKVPYDRPNTTMSDFIMCPSCRNEYENPLDRRFHAQPTACPDCGPQLALADAAGHCIEGNPIQTAQQWLREGKILAIKGLGGFHLAVRADNRDSVEDLRRRKHRDAKPLALMCGSLEEVERLVVLSERGKRLLTSYRAPILLAPRRPQTNIAKAVAPGQHRLGVMLPYTPIQHLLFNDPTIGPLVMTSANTTDEPLVIDNDEAVERLGKTGLCDGFLWHDRAICRCVDDSVLIDMAEGAPLPLRRARGYVPSHIDLPFDVEAPGLCLGGDLKNTIAVVNDHHSVLSQHLGDLKHPLAYEYFQQCIGDLLDLCGVRPEWVTHDLHPLYQSTAYAQKLAEKWDARLIPIQHHHAHAAAVMAEHDLVGPALAIVCDGTGYGEDGAIWGGELLLADYEGYRRLAHLQPLPLAGGDAAAKDTRRCGLALLSLLDRETFGESAAAGQLYPVATERQMLSTMIRQGTSSPLSSGAGRYFDGIAALLGLCSYNQYEAQAAQLLEAAAYRYGSFETDERLYRILTLNGCQIDLSPCVDYVLRGQNESIEAMAAMWHEQFVSAWAEVAVSNACRTGVRQVVLSGGVFCNAILTARLTELLQIKGLGVYRHEQVPPNDGGLALGQAAIAAHQIRKAG